MTDHTTGLRFDIFERIVLPDDVVGIQQLEEIELTPQIHLTTDDDQAILRGQLSLTGSYVGEDLRSGHRLMHTIPVEITLPMNRVSELEQIGVEIENFDVDVLSLRKISVTGVLSLQGVTTGITRTNASRYEEASYPGLEGQHQMQMPTFPGLERTQEATSYTSLGSEPNSLEGSLNRTLEVTREELSENEKKFATREGNEGELESDVADSVFEQPENLKGDDDITNSLAEYGEVERSEELEESGEGFKQSETMHNESNEPLQELEEMSFESESSPQEVAPSQKEGIKIGFNSQKSSEEMIENAKQFQAALTPNRDEAQTQNIFANENIELAKTEISEAAVVDEIVGQEESVKGEEAEWKNFLLNRDGNEERQFSKMRLCIVQKEDTLETIAAKYNLNPREIALYNRLNEHDVAVGQIIYLPQSIS